MENRMVVTYVAGGRFLGIVGVFTSIENVIKGIRAYEDKHLGEEETRRTQWFEIHPYHSQYGDRGEMHCIDGVMSTFIITMDVMTDHPVGLPLPDPHVAGYTMRE